jgi:signal peptidase I
MGKHHNEGQLAVPVLEARMGPKHQNVSHATVAPKSVVREYTEALVVALLLALFIRSFLVQAYKIPSESMLPTLQIGDHLLVNKLAYGLRLPFPWEKLLVAWAQPSRGDVIVFVDPQDRTRDLIKRVIATAGETVDIRHKQIYINGEKVDDPRASFTDNEREIPGPRDNFGPVTVPPHHVFTMGDNRDRSYDSRFWGFANLDDVEGKAMLIYWSWDGLDRWVRWERIGSLIP